MISQEAQRRAKILTFWEKHGDEATGEAFDVSRRTLFRWQTKLWKEGGKLEALNSGNRAPNKRRKRDVPMAISERVITLRKEHPRLGKDKIHAILRLEGYEGSASTIGRILGDLKEKGRIPKHTH
ncbi:MAG TPA: helix-turn-helix domain-containing protein, partial [Candidatus Paceibacterota bacterium]